MKFQISRKHFANGLAQVVSLIGPRTQVAILNNVLLEAAGDTLSLTTTNLDIGVRVRLRAHVSTPGVITLPARKLQAVVAAGRSAEVVVETTGVNIVKITAGKFNAKIVGIPPDTFPALTTFANQHNFQLDQNTLASLIRKVAYAQSSDANRYVLNGVHFKFADDRLTLVATDGRRLALVAQPFDVGPESAGEFILPAKAVSEMQHLLGSNGTVKIAFDERHVSFTLEGGALVEPPPALETSAAGAPPAASEAPDYPEDVGEIKDDVPPAAKEDAADAAVVADAAAAAAAAALAARAEKSEPKTKAADLDAIDYIFVVSKVVEGQFPNYQLALPKEVANRIEVEREEFINVIRSGRIMASDKADKNTFVDLVFKPNELVVKSENAEIGEVDDKMAIVYDGPEVEIGFNPQFLLDALSSLDDDNITFDFKDVTSQGVIRASSDFACVVMPQRK